MTNGIELKKQQQHALSKAEAILAAAEKAGRDMTASEELDYNTSMAAFKALSPQVKKWEANNTILNMVGNTGMIITDGGRRIERHGPRVRTFGRRS